MKWGVIISRGKDHKGHTSKKVSWEGYLIGTIIREGEIERAMQLYAEQNALASGLQHES